MKLAACYPWDSPFMFTSFVDTALNMQCPENTTLRWFRGEGWCAARRHIDCLEKAVAWGADLVCYIGSDQIHPEDMFPRLVERIEQGYEVITAMVPMRCHIKGQGSKPFQPMAWRHIEGSFVPIDPEDGNVQKIDVIGSGVLMFPVRLLDKMAKPWFKDSVDPETQKRRQIDDSLFVWRLGQEAGASIYVDVTIKVKHSHVFDIDETFSDRFSDWTPSPRIEETNASR